ncbi:c-type cytochrome [Thioalkalivibrio sp. HK1]|uniref:c-type cytochrome n=1 Tax=Thioalkalivibrio sp. HK1 TaxID=1469245 RepID=UPI000471D5E1|nr:cytochrome c [Thioalkalivibrio sp. HK1]
MHINLAIRRICESSPAGAFPSAIDPKRRLAGKAILAPLVGMVVAIGSFFFPALPALAQDSAPSYKEHIKCEDGKCKVDLWLVRGYRAFSQCQVCHGLDGTGSTIAPSLLDKMLEIDHARYVEVVTNGYQGQVGVMPAWKENPNVMKYIDQLYAYLMARADGTLPAGRLERYDR